jgi:hypothetical protein
MYSIWGWKESFVVKNLAKILLNSVTFSKILYGEFPYPFYFPLSCMKTVVKHILVKTYAPLKYLLLNLLKYGSLKHNGRKKTTLKHDKLSIIIAAS